MVLRHRLRLRLRLRWGEGKDMSGFRVRAAREVLGLGFRLKWIQ